MFAWLRRKRTAEPPPAMVLAFDSVEDKQLDRRRLFQALAWLRQRGIRARLVDEKQSRLVILDEQIGQGV